MLLRGDQSLPSPKDLFGWQILTPPEIQPIRIQAAFRCPGSTLILVSMPHAVWTLLPSHSAYSFIATVGSDNFLLPPASLPIRRMNNSTVSSDVASTRQGIANDGQEDFDRFLQARNVDFHDSADPKGKSFLDLSLADPPRMTNDETQPNRIVWTS